MPITFDASLVTKVEIISYYASGEGQRVFSGIRVAASNGFSKRWSTHGGTSNPDDLPWDTDADLRALRQAIQDGVIPASRVRWPGGYGDPIVEWHPDGDGYPFRLKPILLRFDPFALPESLGGTDDAAGTVTTHWHKVGSGTPPVVEVPSLSAYPGSTIDSIMTAAGWTESIPTGDPLFVLEVIEVDGEAFTRGPRTSTRRYSTDGGTTWTTIRPTDLSSLTDIQEYLHGTWVTTGAPTRRHDRRWINWQSTAEQRRQFIPLSIPSDAIEIWFYIQDAGGTWDTSKFKFSGWAKLPIANLKKILPTYVGSGVEWTDEDAIYRIWGSLKGGGAASIGICYDSDLVQSGMWGIDLCFVTYPQVVLNANLNPTDSVITLASGHSFYGFEADDILYIPTVATRANSPSLGGVHFNANVIGSAANGWDFWIGISATGTDISAPIFTISTDLKFVRGRFPRNYTFQQIVDAFNARSDVPFVAALEAGTAGSSIFPAGFSATGVAAGGYDAEDEHVRIFLNQGQSATVVRGVDGTTAAPHASRTVARGIVSSGKLRGMQILRAEGLSQDTLLETYFRREGER